MLIFPPYDSLSSVLGSLLLREPHFGLFQCAVAWVRASGVAQVADELSRFPGQKRVIVGIDLGHTSYEGLFALYHLVDDLTIFRTSRQIYHPKVYSFSPVGSRQKAVCIVGSCNFTFGGLDQNFEAAWVRELDLACDTDLADYKQITSVFDRWRAEPGCQRIESLETIDLLLERGEISLERGAVTSNNSPKFADSMELNTRNPTPDDAPRAYVTPQRAARSLSSLKEILANRTVAPAPPPPDTLGTPTLDLEQASAYFRESSGLIHSDLLYRFFDIGLLPGTLRNETPAGAQLTFRKTDIDVLIPMVRGIIEHEREHEREQERQANKPPKGFLDLEDVQEWLEISGDQVHALVGEGRIRTHPPYKALESHRYWYVKRDVQELRKALP